MLSSARMVAAAATLAVVAGVLVWIYRQGGDGVRNSVERQNNEAANSADTKRLDYDACSHSGGLWNFGAGKCERPARRGRH
ncbi:hypothetical protein CO656_04940 [Sinorhizobium sp. FG01]|uniref:Uncharacterized protein n=1 Tax=Sinorhizobium americanum TaxID=194963 RepID=A0A2S3YPQ1_9HYPH|nr:hypothetical protein CO656_04940 [Sinorhizobium sp. FG01]POH32908.1 hypothetical protein ATY31_13560 [Sinorhizobium americanum]